MESTNLNINSESINYSFLSVDPKSFDVLPKEGQEQYINEALSYINKTLPGWAEGLNSNIIGLAKLAHRWNKNESPKIKFKHLESEMKDVNRFIERRKKIGLSYESYAKELQMMEAERASMKLKYPELNK
jgi:hypothetical protein